MSLFTELTPNEQANLSGGSGKDEHKKRYNKNRRFNRGGAGGAGGDGGDGGDAVLIIKKSVVIVKGDLNVEAGDGGAGGAGGAGGSAG